MKKQRIIVTGLNGLIGSKFKEVYQDKYDLLSLGRSPANSENEVQVDITDIDALEQIIQRETEAKFIIHMAAFTDVTAAFAETGDENGAAYRANVIATQNLVELAKSYDKHLIHFSTAYVFDGEKAGLYTEEDKPAAIEWYGLTKQKAEEAILNSSVSATILRLDQPFRSDMAQKADVAHKIIAGLQAETLYPQFDNHFFGPTYIDDLVKVMDWAIRTSPTGIWHATSGEKWSDYDFAQLINEELSLGAKIERGDLEKYLVTAVRPYQRNTALDNSKLVAAIDFELKTIAEAVAELKY